MPKITYAQVEVAFDAYCAVECQPDRSAFDAMRAALEAYERVRDVERILSPDAVDVGLKLTAKAAAEGYPTARDLHDKLTDVRTCHRYVEGQKLAEQAENDARVEQALESLRHKVKEGYQR